MWFFKKKEEPDPLENAQEMCAEPKAAVLRRPVCDLTYLINLVKSAESCLRKYDSSAYDRLLSELENAQNKDNWGHPRDAERGVLYASRDMDEILLQAIQGAEQEDMYRIAKEEFEILKAVFWELRAVRWNYNDILYHNRFS